MKGTGLGVGAGVGGGVGGGGGGGGGGGAVHSVHKKFKPGGQKQKGRDQTTFLPTGQLIHSPPMHS